MSITLKTIEDNLPNDLVETICRLRHKSMLRQVHTSVKCHHYFDVLKTASLQGFLATRMNVEMFTGYTMRFYLYRQNTKYIFVGHWDDIMLPKQQHLTIMAIVRSTPSNDKFTILHAFVPPCHKQEKRLKSHITSMIYWTVGKPNEVKTHYIFDKLKISHTMTPAQQTFITSL